MSNPAPPCAFVIFGITGDLSARKLMPALFALHESGDLHPETRIIGYARSDWSNERLCAEVRQALDAYSGRAFSPSSWEAFAARFSYVQGAYDTQEGYDRLKGHLDDLGLETHVFYTSTPPATYELIVRGLAAAKLNDGQDDRTRVVIEKPFGYDLQTARALNTTVLAAFKESQVYRIDHYLAKETAQNLSVLRFANTFFEPVWNNQYIDHVQITMSEPMGVEGRGGFYEDAGVIRDVFQNHLLQLVALIATEPPARFDDRNVRNEKVKVLQAMACPRPEHAVIGQYTRGNNMKGYREEEGVAPNSRQGTYAAVEFRIENWRWAGVPFFVRSGKRLEGKASEIVLHLKKPPHIPFKVREGLKADRLVMRLVPDEGISLRFNTKKPGPGIDMTRVTMDFYYDTQFERPNPDAYETLLLDVMKGDATLFMRADEVEEQWRIVQPLLAYWEASDESPAFYAAGSGGPREAYDLLERQGRYWHKPDNEKRR